MFLRYNILTPTWYATINQDLKLKIIHPVASECKVIYKPNDNFIGQGIVVYPWKDIFKIKFSSPGIIEEYFPIDPPTHYRVVTVSNQKDPVFKLASYQITDYKNKIISNRGTVTISKNNFRIHEEFIKLHQKEFPQIFVISWDFLRVMNFKNNNQYNSISEYALEGNINGAICWKTSCREILERLTIHALIYLN